MGLAENRKGRIESLIPWPGLFFSVDGRLTLSLSTAFPKYGIIKKLTAEHSECAEKRLMLKSWGELIKSSLCVLSELCESQ